MENHVKYRDSIYFHDDRSLYVNLFIPSAVVWKEKGAQLVQRTSFPDVPATSLQWTLRAPAAIALQLRHPRWSRTAILLVNGREVARALGARRYDALARR